MVRQIGFGRVQSAGGRDDPVAVPAPTDGRPQDGRQKLDGAARWIVVGFLAFWLVGWSTGIYFAFGALIGNGAQDLAASAFVVVWLAVAIGGWLFAVWTILRLLSGRPLTRRQRG